MTIQIGDEVEVIRYENYCPYSWTKPGSKGIVIDVRGSNNDSVTVSWHFFNSSCRDPIGSTYTVEACYLKVVSPAIILADVNKKYSKIIAKMKQMEAKRKSLGYKTYG